MDKSQRRSSGQEAPRSGHRRLRVIAVLSLTAYAVAYFAYGPGSDSPVESAAEPAVFACNSSPASGGADMDSCIPDLVSLDEPGAPESLPGEEIPPALIATEQAPANGRQSVTRGWQTNASEYNVPRPRYTMAELCAAGLDDNVLQCQAGSYDGRFLASGSGVTAGAASGYSISGQVLTTDGRGLEGVTIVAAPARLVDGEIVGPAETLRFWTVTDALGEYSLDGLPDGEYTIRSRAHGPYQAAHIIARVGVDYADLIVAENARAVAKGQVLTADGGPLEGVTVLPVLPGQASVLTGDDGFFELPVSLKPSVQSFALRFQRPGFKERTDTIVIDHAVPASAAITTTPAVKVVMQPVAAWSELSGTVYSDSGEPLPGRRVELSARAARQQHMAITDKDGHYRFPFIEAGADYRLTVFGGPLYKDDRQLFRSTDDTTAIDITVDAYEFGEVAGQLVNLNGEPIPDFELVLRNTASRQPNALVRTDAQGNFFIAAAPAGELVVASQSTPSILVRGLRLTPGDKLNVPLVLDWGEHEIRGSVVDARNNPVPASRIILQWSHQVDGVTTNATRRTAANAAGQFAFSNLGPGPHSLRIDAPGFSTVDVDHDLSRQGYDLKVRLN